MPWEKSFDVETALEKAREVFWTKGYDATSLCDLLDAMGIQKGSFYATYGSKRDLYDRALEGYCAERGALFAELTAGKSPREGLRAIVRAILRECTAPEGERGCMVTNCAIELGHSDPRARGVVRRAYDAQERMLADLIRAGQESGECSGDLDPKATAKAMLAMMVGMRVFARSGASKAALRTLADQTMALVDR